MHLSAPIYRLKRQAKILSRQQGIALHAALDHIAQAEGFATWSLLVDRQKRHAPGKTLAAELHPGDLVLLAARPGQGKTMLGVEFLIATLRRGAAGAFFTLEYTPAEMAQLFASLNEEMDRFGNRFAFHDSNDISADYVMGQLAEAPIGTAVVIDFLQVMDQNREHPPLAEQVATLREFGQQRGLIIVCISQVDRSFEQKGNPQPTLEDVRLPNPVDLSLFNRTCFVQDGQLLLN